MTMRLQQTGEHDESATLPLLAEIGLSRYGEIPLLESLYAYRIPAHMGICWVISGIRFQLFPIMLWGGINGMKVSIFLTFIVAGLGQWILAYVMGLRPRVSAMVVHPFYDFRRSGFALAGGLV